MTDTDQAIPAEENSITPDQGAAGSDSLPSPVGVKKNNGIFSDLLSMFIVAAICSVLSVFVYDKYFAQKVMIFKMKDYVAAQGQLIRSGEKTVEQVSAELDEINANLDGIPKNRLVLLGDVVLRNANYEFTYPPSK